MRRQCTVDADSQARHNIGAVVVLAVHVFQLLDHRGQASEIAQIEGDFEDTTRFLQMILSTQAPDPENNQYKLSQQGSVALARLR